MRDGECKWSSAYPKDALHVWNVDMIKMVRTCDGHVAIMFVIPIMLHV